MILFVIVRFIKDILCDCIYVILWKKEKIIEFVKRLLVVWVLGRYGR